MKSKGIKFDDVTIEYIRYASAEEWEKENPILGKYVFGYDTDNQTLKIGDGITCWTDLKSIV